MGGSFAGLRARVSTAIIAERVRYNERPERFEYRLGPGVRANRPAVPDQDREMAAAKGRGRRVKASEPRSGLDMGPVLLNDARCRTSVIAVKDSFYVVPIRCGDEAAAQG